MGKTNKVKYTATHRRAKYIGNHPHIKDKEGVYYWSNRWNSYVFKPNTVNVTKTDWYRVHLENIVEME